MTGPKPLTATSLQAANIRHGLFTREGGVSAGIYQGLNCGFGSRDDRDCVAENRRRVADTLGVSAETLITIHQIHSADAIAVDMPWSPAEAPRGDAMVTDRPGIALGVLAADCAPVLFADAQAGVIGAAHAGWRGALTGILAATVAAMETLGADRTRIAATVGPCIGQPSYEVGAEFHAAFAAEGIDTGRYFVPSDRAGHHRFDLPGFVRDRLGALGIAGVEMLAHDTYADPERFFSYRRATHKGEDDYGRQISAIALI
jgi:hypothetical protein